MTIETPYWCRIYEKDYSGNVSNIILAELPFALSQQTDDIRATVRGHAISLTIKNTGSLPVSTFQSVNDDQFRVDIGTGAAPLFTGYIVQDDSGELMVDYTHDIVLQVNDNLGLLKDVAFNLHNTVITDFYARNSLAACIHQCLKNTGLELQTYVYVNLWEDRMTETDSPFPQCFVDCNLFINGSTTDTNGKATDTFMSCYDVLDRILDRFNCSLFQACGRWNIVRWDELRGLTTIHAFVYDADWNMIDSKLLPDAFTADPVIGGASIPAMFPETGLTKQIVRPFLFDKETFNYQQPKYLLKNYDLQTLGALIRTYVDTDGNTVSEYVATGWTNSWPLADSARAIQGTPFESTNGDKVKVSFQFSTNFGVSYPATIIFAVRLYDGVSNRYIDELPADDGAWIPGIGFNFTLPVGSDITQWQSVEIASSQIPFDGLTYVYLAAVGTVTLPYERFIRVVTDSLGNEVARYLVGRNGTNETRYTDIRVEYTQFINDSTKVIGHVHKDLQTDAVAQTIKNNEDIQIYIDDSPSNQAVGTLFLATFHSLVQDRTSRWHRAGYTESLRLGQIMTTETLQWRSLPRTKLEGTFYGLVQNSLHLALLIPLKFSYLGVLRFIYGQIEIDMRNNRVKCTAWELTGQAGEFAVNQIYTFTYIYSAR